ncbi:AAA family ATPase [Marinomonas sp. S3726]|uniref:AAA family ATPase n=1 Tax=Marinomonas sp. S3726 TaxID=579484 RepID=UPI0006965A13|nr:AAA family ATPase [Marinomonas sp. S3726]
MKSEIDIVTLSKLALSGKEADIRMYLAKAVRKLRTTDPETSKKIEALLKDNPARSNEVLRKSINDNHNSSVLGTSGDSAIPLLKSFSDNIANYPSPILSTSLEEQLSQIIKERKHAQVLSKLGLTPCSSIIFQGPPGVGKTMTANWLASQLQLPFYTLDLTAVMSSYLGKTGSNLRAVIDFAKSHPCVLLLDEIDAIAKKRSDDADVGELKRLVTVMLQELESWPSTGLLIAATNHPELVDPALWRRFDLEVSFSLPSTEQTTLAINNFLGDDLEHFSHWIPLCIQAFKGDSYSNIKKRIHKLRKMRILEPNSFEKQIIKNLLSNTETMTRSERIDLATRLVLEFKTSQVKASELTGVSRDTIRKKLKENQK